jgi:hypothetical protein
MELAPDEASRLASAAQEVAKQYPIIADPKTQAWLQCAAVAGVIYIPRGLAIRARRKEELRGGQTAPLVQPVSAAAATNGGARNGGVRPATTPSELDPVASLAGQAAAGAA